MPIRRRVGGRAAPGRGRAPHLASLTLLLIFTGCSTAETEPESAAPGGSAGAATALAIPPPTPSPTPTPTPTPEPTPRFTNEPDADLAGLIPAAVDGVTLVIPPLEEYGITPGDIGAVYGEIGDRFQSLVVAYADQPRTALYALRLVGDPVSTEDLEPHLAEAGRYVGIAGLHREPWELTAVGDHLVWRRAEDHATSAGTHVYTWAAEEYVFLLIGVDEGVNQALVTALPGEPPPSPSPSPSPPEESAPSSASAP